MPSEMTNLLILSVNFYYCVINVLGVTVMALPIYVTQSLKVISVPKKRPDHKYSLANTLIYITEHSRDLEHIESSIMLVTMCLLCCITGVV